jgi:hypothetical protein
MSDARPLDAALRRRRLYIDHLAAMLQKMDSGRLPMQALAYRLFAKRLREALAGLPERGDARPAVVQATQANRFFDQTGRLPGIGGAAAQRIAQAAIERARRRDDDGSR